MSFIPYPPLPSSTTEKLPVSGHLRDGIVSFSTAPQSVISSPPNAIIIILSQTILRTTHISSLPPSNITFLSHTIAPTTSISSLPPSITPNLPQTIAPTTTIFSLPTSFTTSLPQTIQPAPSEAPPKHPEPPISVIVPIAVVLGLAVAAAVLFLTIRSRLRRRRPQVVQDAGHVQYGDLQGDHDSAARDSLMAEHDTSRIPSIVVGFIGGRHSAGVESGVGGGGVSGQNDSPHTRRPRGVPLPWARSPRSKASQRDPTNAPSSPSVFSGEPLETQAQPPRRETSTEDPDTVLLRLPTDFARGLMALVAGANVRGVRYAGESEDGQGSEDLPAYESEPSASEVDRARSAS
ncbi:hypothetical protein VTO73DRAFT_10084 [Trametes versicolor]